MHYTIFFVIISLVVSLGSSRSDKTIIGLLTDANYNLYVAYEHSLDSKNFS